MNLSLPKLKIEGIDCQCEKCRMHGPPAKRISTYEGLCECGGKVGIVYKLVEYASVQNVLTEIERRNNAIGLDLVKATTVVLLTGKVDGLHEVLKQMKELGEQIHEVRK